MCFLGFFLAAGIDCCFDLLVLRPQPAEAKPAKPKPVPVNTVPPIPRPPPEQPLPLPFDATTATRHLYIAGQRVLSNRGLVRALEKDYCVDLVERDFEFRRVSIE